MKKKTIIRLSITLIVIVALGLWINSRWSAWFHNEEELPYAPLSEPGRVLLTFGDENELSRNISWQYDSIVVPSHVDLVDTLSKDTIQIEAQGETFRSRSGIAAYYVAKLRSLHPDRIILIVYAMRARPHPGIASAHTISPPEKTIHLCM